MNVRQQPESKYDLLSNPIYQVDWINEASGKRIRATKRRVRFRFGFSNRQAILDGRYGMACRGEEHEVSVEWIISSGKQFVLLDGNEIHSSVGETMDAKLEANFFVHSYTIKVICYATPPICFVPGFRQFDMHIDGYSFFELPRVSELGDRNDGIINRWPLHGSPSTKSSSSNTSPRCVRFAHNLEQVRSIPSRHEDAAAAADVDYTGSCYSANSTPVDLLDSYPSHDPRQETASPSNAHHVDSSAVYWKQQLPFSPLLNETNPFLSQLKSRGQVQHLHPQKMPSGYTQQQTAYYHRQQREHCQMPVQRQQVSPYHPVVQHRTYQQHGSILQQKVTTYQQPMAHVCPTPQNDSTFLNATMNNLSLEQREQPVKRTVLDKAIDSLVNFDDIRETKTTPEQHKTEQRKLQKTAHTNRPVKPTEFAWNLGKNVSLADIQARKPAKQVRPDIMRCHYAFDARACQMGTMVAYKCGSPSLVQRGFE